MILTLSLPANPDRLMEEAIEENSLSKAEQAISQKLNINKKIPHRGTYLCYSIDNGAIEIAKLLIKKGANISQGNEQGSLPVHTAMEGFRLKENQALEIMEILLAKGADINAKRKTDYGIETPLDIAFEYYTAGFIHQKRKIILYLLERKARFNFYPPDTRIALAAGHYDYEMLQALRKAGYSPKQKPDYYDVLTGYKEPFTETDRIKLLLMHRCNKSPKNFCADIEPFFKEDISHFAEKKNIEEMLFFSAIELGMQDFGVQMLLTDPGLAKRKIKEVLPILQKELNPVCTASAKGLIKLTLELIRQGADPNDFCNGGQSPLFLAVKHSEASAAEEFIPKLVKAGAKVRGRTSNGNTPLHYAVYYADLKILKLLVKLDSSWINPMNQDRFTPFTSACKENNLAKAKYLLENGAKAFLKDRWGGTCAHTIAGKPEGHIELLQLLHKSGLDLNAEDSAGNTPMQYAKFGIERGPNPKAVEYLKSLGISDKVKKPNLTPFTGIPWYGFNSKYGELEYEE